MKISLKTDEHWMSVPGLKVSHGEHTDEYRLAEGKVEFRPAQGKSWRELKYTDLQQHFTLETPVGRWLARLYSTAKLGKVLSN